MLKKTGFSLIIISSMFLSACVLSTNSNAVNPNPDSKKDVKVESFALKEVIDFEGNTLTGSSVSYRYTDGTKVDVNERFVVKVPADAIYGENRSQYIGKKLEYSFECYPENADFDSSKVKVKNVEFMNNDIIHSGRDINESSQLITDECCFIRFYYNPDIKKFYADSHCTTEQVWELVENKKFTYEELNTNIENKYSRFFRVKDNFRIEDVPYSDDFYDTKSYNMYEDFKDMFYDKIDMTQEYKSLENDTYLYVGSSSSGYSRTNNLNDVVNSFLSDGYIFSPEGFTVTYGEENIMPKVLCNLKKNDCYANFENTIYAYSGSLEGVYKVTFEYEDLEYSCFLLFR